MLFQPCYIQNVGLEYEGVLGAVGATANKIRCKFYLYITHKHRYILRSTYVYIYLCLLYPLPNQVYVKEKMMHNVLHV